MLHSQVVEYKHPFTYNSVLKTLGVFREEVKGLLVGGLGEGRFSTTIIARKKASWLMNQEGYGDCLVERDTDLAYVRR